MILTYRLTPSGLESYPVSNAFTLDEFTRLLPSGFYTTFRTFDERRRVLGLSGHLQRLYRPAWAHGIQPAVDPQQLRLLLVQALAAQEGEARLRLVLTRQGEMYLALERLTPLPAEVYTHGVRVITLRLRRRRPDEKATDFILLSQEARQRVRQAGVFEGMMVWRGRILEGLTSNFFYVYQGRLGTARRGVLPGVTRRIVLRLARQAGLEVIGQALRVEETCIDNSGREFRVVGQGMTTPTDRSQGGGGEPTLPHISEAFLTSSSRGVVPIVQIDDHVVGTGEVGPITRQLQQAYEAYIQCRAEAIVRSEPTIKTSPQNG